jgi:hypothetical protein
MAKLLIACCISITRYFVALYRVSCSYHSYVGKVIKVRILWHHNGPFGLLSSHSSCFFMGVRPSLTGSMCCSHLLKMLSFDHSCTSLLFPMGQSLSQPYFEESVRMKLTFLEWELGSSLRLPKLQSSIAGVKTPCIVAFFISLESY